MFEFLRALRGPSGHPLSFFGPSGVHFGTLWGPFGPFGPPFGTLFRPFGGAFWLTFGRLCPNPEKGLKLNRFWGPVWAYLFPFRSILGHCLEIFFDYFSGVVFGGLLAHIWLHF